MDLFEKTAARVRQMVDEGRLNVTYRGTYMKANKHLGEAPVCEVCAVGALIYALPRPDPRDNNDYLYGLWANSYSVANHEQAMELVSPLRKHVSEHELSRFEYAFMYQREYGLPRDELLGLLPDMCDLPPNELREMESYFPPNLPGRERLLALIANLEAHRTQHEGGAITYTLDFSVPWTDLLPLKDISQAWQQDKEHTHHLERSHRTYREFASKVLLDPKADEVAQSVARNILDRDEVWQSKGVHDDEDDEDDSYYYGDDSDT